MCAQLPKTPACPANTVLHTRPSKIAGAEACDVWCKAPNGRAHGPSARVVGPAPFTISTGRFLRGQPHGRWLVRRAGTVITEENYNRGTRHGRFCTTHRKGRSCNRMRNGTGVLRRYSDAGKLNRIVPMRRGKFHGITKQWDARGRLILTRQHYNGEMRMQTEWEPDACGRAPTDVQSWRKGKRHGLQVERECRNRRVIWVSRKRYCRGTKCGVWTRRSGRTKARERETYDRSGTLIAKTVWSDSGRVVDSWSKAAMKRAEHNKCLRELKRGGCCDPEQNPPRGAKLCINGSRPNRRP